jgi:Holliday junction resolvase RusA-like endonuclease
MAVYKLRIERWSPTPLNKLMRGTIHARIRFERIDRNIIMGYCLHNRIPRAQGRREVSIKITLPPRGRESDVDALWKSTLDGLVRAGMLIDDHRKYCKIGEVTYERGEELSTLIELTDLEGDTK